MVSEFWPVWKYPFCCGHCQLSSCQGNSRTLTRRVFATKQPTTTRFLSYFHHLLQLAYFCQDARCENGLCPQGWSDIRPRPESRRKTESTAAIPVISKKYRRCVAFTLSCKSQLINYTAYCRTTGKSELIYCRTTHQAGRAGRCTLRQRSVAPWT